MQPEDHKNGLYVIMQALENSGFEAFRPGNGPAYDGRAFSIHPSADYDCDCGQEAIRWKWEEETKHSASCFVRILDQRIAAAGRELFDDSDLDAFEARKLCVELGLKYNGLLGHCTCDYATRRNAADLDCRPVCIVETPNFIHKPTGLRIDWYKYAGRGMTVENPVEASQWDRIVIDCLNEAIGADPTVS